MIANILSIASLLIAACTYLLTERRLRRADTRQAELYVLQQAAAAWAAPPMVAAKRIIASGPPLAGTIDSHPAGAQDAICAVLDHLHRTGTMARRGLVPVGLLLDLDGGSIAYMWRQVVEVVTAERTARCDTAYRSGAEWLATQAQTRT